MKKLLSPALSLFFICLATTLALAVVYNITAPQIKSRAMEDQKAAQQEVLPLADSFQEIRDFSALDASGLIKSVYEGKQGAQVNGYVFIAAPKGYAGPVETIIGVDTTTLSITELRIISSTETPGLGQKAADAAFYSQFSGKAGQPALHVVNQAQARGSAEEIDAITSATITSKAVTKAAQAALDLAAALKEKGVQP